ncbi:hypothetical protein FRC07_012824 [Ceratobasidium sp. 392]|nr:hypothetical protein FRC07_012824 [Ceratobasidium sp. 392]
MQAEAPVLVATNPTDAEDMFEKKADHCYICEDGGRVVECTICSKCFCYNVIGEQLDFDHPACVTVPAEVANRDDQAWPCPECLSLVRARTAPYIINRGARKTLRLACPTALVVVVFTIHSLQALAKALLDQIVATFGVFETNVATARCFIHHGLPEEDEIALRDELGSSLSYHLAIVIVTESHPGGGWWQTSNHGSLKQSQGSEDDVLKRCLYQVRRLTREAVTSRLFFSACGMNLPGKDAVSKIHRHLTSSRYLSILLPTTSNLQQGEYLHMLPELFLNIYYFGSDLRSAIYRVWGKSPEVRHHTGLLIMDRKVPGEMLSVTKLTYSPPKYRPFGVGLPEAGSVCGCLEEEAGWEYKKEVPHGREVLFVYSSKCFHVQLHVAIYPGRRRMVVMFGCNFTEEDWNLDTRSFEFKESTMVRMKTFAVRTPLQLDAPWTIAGRRLVPQQAPS